MNDPHLQWIADCRLELADMDLDDIESNRLEAQAALARVQAAGDPRGVGPRYEELLQELARQEATVRLDEVLADLDIAGLETLLASEEREVRIKAIQRTEEMGLEGGFEVLKVHLVRESDPHVIATGIKALGPLGGVRAIPVYQEYRAHVDPRVRANAVEGLCNAGAGPDELRPWTQDLDHRVRANAAFGLMDGEPKTAREVFRGLLAEGSASGQRAVMGILERIDPDRFLEPYLDAIDLCPPELLGDVFQALTRKPDARITRLVLELLEDQERSFAFRSKAMQAARQLAANCGEDEESWKELLEGAVSRFLQDITETERAERDELLGEVSGDEALPDGGEVVEEPPRPSGAAKQQAMARRWVRLFGRVLDSATRKPIPQAIVRVASSGRQESTDRLGRFQLDRLLRGETYVFVVERRGYPTRSVRHRCSGSQDQSIQILLVGSRS